MIRNFWRAAWVGLFMASSGFCDGLKEDVSPLHPGCAGDYGMTYWLDGLRSPEYVVQTSRYALKYDHRLLGPVAMGALTQFLPEDKAHLSPVPDIPPVAFSCLVHVGPDKHAAKPASDDPRASAIVESGRFFQRRWQTATVPGIPCDTGRSGLELSAWPDRLTLQFRFCPQEAVSAGALEISIDLGEGWKARTSGKVMIILSPGGQGYVCLPLQAADALAFDDGQSVLRMKSSAADWPAKSHPMVGIVLHPVGTRLDAKIAAQQAVVESPLAIQAAEVEPDVPSLVVRYGPAQDWHRISIPKGTPGDDGRMRARISLKNPTDITRMARLVFDGVPFYVPGLSAVLRDHEGFPIGIPVQLSKNWHGTREPEDHPARFSGEWFHGITMMELPAKTAIELELMMVGENWGGMAAASHAQLSTIGYGGNQQWDQAALGNRGEALCYDMDHVLTDNCFTDARPFGMTNPAGQRGWNINIGGGSVLRFNDPSGTPVPNRRMRVQYPRYGPNLAEARFSGTAADGSLDFSYSAAIFRADDCTRGFHRISIHANRDTEFGRLAIYQQAGDSYHYNQGSTLSWGNASRPEPIRTWQASGQPGEPVGEAFPLDGPAPWLAVTGGTAEQGYHPANHGFIIRSWKARLGGKTVPVPYARERRTAGNVSILELVPPPGVKRLNKGDFVELDLVRIYVPQSADHYAGTNAPFREALRMFPNDPRMILREAAGNHIIIKPTVGRLISNYPPVIQTNDNRAGFQLRGGIGALPVTFTGLTDYRHPVLEEKTADGWKAIDQSVAGRDFWQCDYDATRKTWEITFTLKPDDSPRSLQDLISKPQVREYRFRAGIEHLVPRKTEAPGAASE